MRVGGGWGKPKHKPRPRASYRPSTLGRTGDKAMTTQKAALPWRVASAVVSRVFTFTPYWSPRFERAHGAGVTKHARPVLPAKAEPPR